MRSSPLKLPGVLASIAASDTDVCIIWPGRLDRYGYGRFGKDSTLAHRLVFEALVGPIAPGLTLDHICFTRSCVNPRHLREMSRVDNSRRQRSAAKTHCDHGHLYSIENTYIRPCGSRDCRACIRDRARRYAARRRAA